MRRYLLFATETYALPILRPLARAAQAAGDAVAWFALGDPLAHLAADEHRLGDARAVCAWRPDAVFAASNWVPHFFPGAKVQVFHGFNVEKRPDQRGHFRLRNLFDLYCTQGPATTQPFLALAAAHPHFAVVETGWPKLDPLFLPDHGAAAALRPHDARAVIMYAATFTPALSSATALYDTIARRVASGEHYWLLTLHPKTEPALVARYRALAGPNARFLEAPELIPMLRAADVLVSDTSSVVSEFVVQGKPVITLRNRVPKPHMIDIQAPEQFDGALRRALAPDPLLLAELSAYAAAIHPWRDGRSSERVLAATADLLSGAIAPTARKPRNLLRKLQVRARLRYFGR